MTRELETIDKSLEETVLSEREEYSGRLLHVLRREVKLPDGRISAREMIAHPGAAAMVVLDDENCTVLERQWRSPLDRAFWEIPAGKIDKGEDPFETACRELEEETGLAADKWVELGTIHNAIGYSDEHIVIYLAKGTIVGGSRELDDNEFIDVHKIPFDEALRMTRDGRITDVKTIIGLNWAEQYLQGKLEQAKEF